VLTQHSPPLPLPLCSVRVSGGARNSTPRPRGAARASRRWVLPRHVRASRMWPGAGCEEWVHTPTLHRELYPTPLP